MSDWVKCSERMPEATKECFVAGLRRGKKVTGLYWYVKDRWPWKPGWVRIYGNPREITHWMPLPEAPED